MLGTRGHPQQKNPHLQARTLSSAKKKMSQQCFRFQSGNNINRNTHQGSKAARAQMSPAEAIAAINMLIPEAENKLRWKNCGPLTKLQTKTRVELRSWARIATQSMFTRNGQNVLSGPGTIGVVN